MKTQGEACGRTSRSGRDSFVLQHKPPLKLDCTILPVSAAGSAVRVHRGPVAVVGVSERPRPKTRLGIARMSQQAG